MGLGRYLPGPGAECTPVRAPGDLLTAQAAHSPRLVTGPRPVPLVFTRLPGSPSSGSPASAPPGPHPLPPLSCFDGSLTHSHRPSATVASTQHWAWELLKGRSLLSRGREGRHQGPGRPQPHASGAQLAKCWDSGGGRPWKECGLALLGVTNEHGEGLPVPGPTSHSFPTPPRAAVGMPPCTAPVPSELGLVLPCYCPV